MDHVLVLTRDVQPGPAMDPMIKDGGREIMVPMDALVDGAATDVSEIEGKTATRPIGKGEQIPVDYLSE